MQNVDYLKGRADAHDIDISLNLAYWAAESGAEIGSAEYHYSMAIISFKALASKLGFRVEKAEPEIVTVSATDVDQEWLEDHEKHEWPSWLSSAELDACDGTTTDFQGEPPALQYALQVKGDVA